MQEPIVGTGGRADRRSGIPRDGARCHAGVRLGAAAASVPSAVVSGSPMVSTAAGTVVWVCVALAIILM
ncbi:hypothetical protein [Rhodococcus sp. B50]|uniref:hypothetical protein n=1 Tax=Rhodococcus sp. B50 TaxID=2682847 RepID=UPI001BD27532|nr:hypothetical protein [Rhodococcus sp. B50]